MFKTIPLLFAFQGILFNTHFCFYYPNLNVSVLKKILSSDDLYTTLGLTADKKKRHQHLDTEIALQWLSFKILDIST